ncbi:MAG: Ku protein [Vicinamibacteria bacterium]|nr:Ku protein [Vicinamibacteria bacterium]
MPPRPLASGTISFGMVSIPVNLYAATESKAAISFNLLHGKCKGRLKQQYVCPKDGNEVVPRADMVKGYEFAKDQYVTFTDDEIKSMQQEANRLIEIAEFVPAAAVDALYFDGAYYVGPDKGADRAYRLLAAAMEKTGRCALARWAARGKQYLVLLRPMGRGLVMQQLLYADEVRGMDEIPTGESEVKEAELGLAVQLVEQIAADRFRPEAYEDEVRKRMQAAIERKVAGQEVAMAPEPKKAEIVDLMEALKASLAARAAAAAAPSAVADDTPQRAAG